MDNARVLNAVSDFCAELHRLEVVLEEEGLPFPEWLSDMRREWQAAAMWQPTEDDNESESLGTD